MASTNEGTYSYEAHGTGTGSAPSGATDGQSLEDLVAVSVVASADSGQTLSGAGTLQCYLYDPVIARWSRAPALDLSCNTASIRDLTFPVMEVLGPRGGRVKWVPASVTISSGGVTVHQLGHNKRVVY